MDLNKFTKAEQELIAELREQDAPIERWAKFFPDAKISDLIRKPIGYYCGEPVYTYHNFIFGEAPPQEYAQRMKKGNIHKWDDHQDTYLTYCFKSGFSTDETIERIKRAFGITRTTGAITSRLQHLGLV